MTDSEVDGLYVSPWPVLKVHGPDAASWLHGIVTGNVLAASPQRACWSSLLSKQGKVQADLHIAGSKDELYLAVAGGSAEDVLHTLDGYLVMEDAEIETTDLVAVVVIGCHARATLEAKGNVPAELDLADSPASILFLEPGGLPGLQEGVPLLEEDLYSRWCTTHGVPRFGVDYSSKDNLHAAALERRTVDWSKGCYLGQEVVCMQDMRGKVKQRLVRLQGENLDGMEDQPVLSEAGAEVGRVTSATAEIAVASVKSAGFEPGTKLSVAGKDVLVAPLR